MNAYAAVIFLLLYGEHMIPPNANYHIALPTPSDYTEAEFEINLLFYQKGIKPQNSYKRFSPEWHNRFNQTAEIAYRIAYEILLINKEYFTFQNIPDLDICAEKLDKINNCVGRTNLFFLKAINLIDSTRENLNFLQEDINIKKNQPTKASSTTDFSKKATLHLNDGTLPLEPTEKKLTKDRKKSKGEPKKFKFSEAHIYKSGLNPPKIYNW